MHWISFGLAVIGLFFILVEVAEIRRHRRHLKDVQQYAEEINQKAAELAKSKQVVSDVELRARFDARVKELKDAGWKEHTFPTRHWSIAKYVG